MKLLCTGLIGADPSHVEAFAELLPQFAQPPLHVPGCSTRDAIDDGYYI